MNFDALKSHGHCDPPRLCAHPPRNCNRPQLGSPPPVKKKKRDNKPDGSLHEVALNDREAWLNNTLSLGERIDLEEGSPVSFFDDDNKLIQGTLIFKGSEDELKTYLEQIPTTNPIEESTALARLSAAEDLIATLTRALTETKTSFTNLERRVKKLEGKKKKGGHKAVETNSTWQTMIAGIPQLISSLPDITTELMAKILAFRGRSSAIPSQSRQDLREMLYRNQAFFILHYYDANTCAGAVYYLLFGPTVAKQAFLPTPFYSQGPRAIAGQRKPCLSFHATSAFFLALDLVIANVFTPDHRLTFITKGRDYINRNVNTMKKHGRTKAKKFDVKAYDDGFGFLEDESLVDDYVNERDTVATDPAVIYNWAIQLGLNYEQQVAPVANGDDGGDDDFHESSEHSE
uniref:Uncharacterized protein n=1 Tax=Panagrolaimus superbus TaxID=310955 RepID=A0A914YYD0_9BILA